tara:strand:+ start:152 stop:568 length:417 start_codon:yes stop_codon:yes gene_type:complete
MHTGKNDRNIELASLKSIVGFLNAQGGNLLIGVNDSGEILGIEQDGFLNSDKTLDKDKYQLHLSHLIRSHINASVTARIKMDFHKFENRHILQVNCPDDTEDDYYLDGDFYLRMAAQTIKLEGRELVNHISSKSDRGS